MIKTSLSYGLLVLTTTLAILGISSASIINQIPHIALAQNTPTGERVQAGGGNTTLPYDVFYPKQIQISPGQSVSWYNPAKVAEPHTVTFVMENKTKAS